MKKSLTNYRLFEVTGPEATRFSQVAEPNETRQPTKESVELQQSTVLLTSKLILKLKEKIAYISGVAPSLYRRRRPVSGSAAPSSEEPPRRSPVPPCSAPIEDLPSISERS